MNACPRIPGVTCERAVPGWPVCCVAGPENGIDDLGVPIAFEPDPTTPVSQCPAGGGPCGCYLDDAVEDCLPDAEEEPTSEPDAAEVSLTDLLTTDDLFKELIARLDVLAGQRFTNRDLTFLSVYDVVSAADQMHYLAANELFTT